MYNPRKLKYSVKIGKTVFKFDFQLWGTATVLLGNSGTGKTLFFRSLDYEEIRQWYTDNFNSSIYLFSDESRTVCSHFIQEIAGKFKIKNALIVMDDAADYMTPKDYDIMIADPNNYYVSITRNVDDIQLSPNYFAEVYRDANGIYRLKYEFTQKRWY